MNLILASGSPRRRVLLGFLVDAFHVHVPNVDESFPPGPVPQAMEAVALRKAQAVSASAEDVVLAADTAVLLGDEILGKPTDAEDAKRMLTALNHADHQVVTAVAVVGPLGPRTFHVSTRVRLELLEVVLEEYLATELWTGKAGGYGLQDELMSTHASIDGPWSNVVGLPLEAVKGALTAQGISCRDAPDETLLRRQNPF